MKKYISQPNDKYTGNNGGGIVNRTISRTKTTREGCSRCDTSDYVSPDLPQNTNISNYSEEEMEQVRIRKLTPKECLRLMGFSERKEVDGKLIHDDSAIDRAMKVNSNAQLYKQAGNSIVVDVLYEIFKEMI